MGEKGKGKGQKGNTTHGKEPHQYNSSWVKIQRGNFDPNYHAEKNRIKGKAAGY